MYREPKYGPKKCKDCDKEICKFEEKFKIRVRCKVECVPIKDDDHKKKYDGEDYDDEDYDDYEEEDDYNQFKKDKMYKYDSMKRNYK